MQTTTSGVRLFINLIDRRNNRISNIRSRCPVKNYKDLFVLVKHQPLALNAEPSPISSGKMRRSGHRWPANKKPDIALLEQTNTVRAIIMSTDTKSGPNSCVVIGVHWKSHCNGVTFNLCTICRCLYFQPLGESCISNSMALNFNSCYSLRNVYAYIFYILNSIEQDTIFNSLMFYLRISQVPVTSKSSLFKS